MNTRKLKSAHISDELDVIRSSFFLEANVQGGSFVHVKAIVAKGYDKPVLEVTVHEAREWSASMVKSDAQSVLTVAESIPYFAKETFIVTQEVFGAWLVESLSVGQDDV